MQAMKQRRWRASIRPEIVYLDATVLEARIPCKAVIAATPFRQASRRPRFGQVSVTALCWRWTNNNRDYEFAKHKGYRRRALRKAREHGPVRSTADFFEKDAMTLGEGRFHRQASAKCAGRGIVVREKDMGGRFSEKMTLPADHEKAGRIMARKNGGAAIGEEFAAQWLEAAGLSDPRAEFLDEDGRNGYRRKKGGIVSSSR